MEEENGGHRSGAVPPDHWWWTAATAVQLTGGISSYCKGYAGDSRLMPLRAFLVASLFVGASATGSVGLLRAYGIRSVEDMKAVGGNIRTGLGISPRARDQ